MRVGFAQPPPRSALGSFCIAKMACAVRTVHSSAANESHFPKLQTISVSCARSRTSCVPFSNHHNSHSSRIVLLPTRVTNSGWKAARAKGGRRNGGDCILIVRNDPLFKFSILIFVFVCIRHCAVCSLRTLKLNSHRTVYCFLCISFCFVRYTHSIQHTASTRHIAAACFLRRCRRRPTRLRSLLLFMPVISLCRAKQQSRTEYFNGVNGEVCVCVCLCVCTRANRCCAVGDEAVELGTIGISFSTNAHRKSDSSLFCAVVTSLSVHAMATFRRAPYSNIHKIVSAQYMKYAIYEYEVSDR